MENTTSEHYQLLWTKKEIELRGRSEEHGACCRVERSLGCKYARLCTFSSHKAIFQDKMILNLLLLELRSSFLHIFFVFLNIIQVKSL